MHLLIALLTTCALTVFAPSSLAETTEKLKSALASDIRSDAAKTRDANRKPIETLTFFGLEDDMRVLELIPGGGWYTELLAPVLAEKGKLFVAVGTQGIERKIADGRLNHVEVIRVDQASSGRAKDGRRYAMQGLKINAQNIDLVLTFRNLHNFDPATRAELNREAFRVLKSGGRYGVVDHTRRHMQKDNDENWRRMDPVLMIKEIESAGFEWIDFSDLHYRYDDELRYEVGRSSVRGNTDRFTLLFKKP
ncbi:MAG: class I SAM-dependent methyltransferase [Gammaproteobacteria bacterium]|nr:class I SAM-dependent methyltransferase [Gammaproteobacteria bacterium]